MINIGDDCDVYSIKPDDKKEEVLHIVLTKQNKYYKTGFARLSPFLISKGRSMISGILYPYKESVKYCHTDCGIFSEKPEGIKSGNDIGNFAFEGYCENVIVQNCTNVKGEFK